MNVGTAGDSATFHQLLDSKVDAIIIATPAEEHANQAIAAIERAIPVFVRKPVGIDLHETQLVVDVARGNCILLGVDLPYRSFAMPAQSASITLADEGLLYDAVDLALVALRAPRIVSVKQHRIEVAGGRVIEISRGATNEVRLDDRKIALQGGDDRALDAFMKRLAQSKEFDDSIESVVDVARVVDEVTLRRG